MPKKYLSCVKKVKDKNSGVNPYVVCAKLRKGDGLFDKVKQTFFNAPNKLPPNSEKIFKKNRDSQVVSIDVIRTPIASGIDKALNVLSLGQWEKNKKDLAYDKMFHLALIFTLRNNKQIIVEKNERINISDKFTIKSDTEIMNVVMPYTFTFEVYIDKARKLMGDHNFYQYDAFENNCQVFIRSILQANGLLTSELDKFIYQPTEELLRGIPTYVNKIARFATDLGAKLNQVFQGGIIKQQVFIGPRGGRYVLLENGKKKYIKK